MTLLNSNSNYSGTPFLRDAIYVVGRRLSSVVNRWVAAVIAQHEYRVNLAILRSLSDRELKDIGIYRGEISEGLKDAAEYRKSRQHSNRQDRRQPYSASGHETD